jgi:hypothetical protein
MNEVHILKQLDCSLINELIDIYEDPEIKKAYLVLEYAGN